MVRIDLFFFEKKKHQETMKEKISVMVSIESESSLVKFTLKSMILLIDSYLNPTLACQTKANKKKSTGITGIISARGPNIAKTPGNLLNRIVSIRCISLLSY